MNKHKSKAKPKSSKINTNIIITKNITSLVM